MTHAAGDDRGLSHNPTPVLFLVIANISKRCNVRSLIASALAFGAEVLVGEAEMHGAFCFHIACGVFLKRLII